MEQNYKFLELQTFVSDEWLANSMRRYRTVFDESEISYMYCDFSCYNKKFDEEDWTCSVRLICVRLSDNFEMCNLESSRTILQSENVFKISESWGKPNFGDYWKHGTYRWSAYIDGKLVSTTDVYIEKLGKITETQNPYFTVSKISLYEGDNNGTLNEHTRFLTQIVKNTSRFVWAKFDFIINTNEAFSSEVTAHFLEDAGMLKGQVKRFVSVPAGEKGKTYSHYFAWGNNAGKTWRDDQYRIDFICNDVLIAWTLFDCGDIEVEGQAPMFTHNSLMTAGPNPVYEAKVQAEQETESLEVLLNELNAMIGLDSVKKSIQENITYLKFSKLRQEKGFKDHGNVALHSVFVGNPGTGKTTIVKKLGQIYHKMGLLSKGHVYEVDRSVLVGEYIGQTAPKVKKAIDAARGGILFIDEAYALVRDKTDNRDFGNEVIEILLKELSDGAGDIAIVAAGYPKEMREFMESNPGLRSRFSNTFYFEDYYPEELMKISEYACNQREVSLEEDAKVYLAEKLTDLFRNRDASFGNARLVHGIIEEAKQEMGIRLMQDPNIEHLDKSDFERLTLADLMKCFAGGEHKVLRLSINEKELQSVLDELNTLIGIQKLKTEIDELVKLIRYYNEIGRDVLGKFNLHTIYTGNPGTGKTTVARIIGKLYKALGLLERGHVVEVDRESLVAAFIGQTAIKTQEKVSAAMGGILFIDEAYALGSTTENDFGKEAVEVILKRMEDDRGKFGVIVAGYPNNMNKFLSTNPGLKSRFDRTFHFDDYNSDELVHITEVLLKSEDLVMNEDVKAQIKGYFEALIAQKDEFFGNARTARQAVSEIIKRQHLRMANSSPSERTIEAIRSVTKEDIVDLKVASVTRRSSVGFKQSEE